ncbi:cytochrome P450 [Daldinia bambusicola]|nr:cytochrome P450 [Daldinia bambusicola]
MLTDVSFTHIAVASVLSLALISIYYVVQWTRHEIKIRKIGGTRAPRLANNPISAATWFYTAAKAQKNHQVLKYFNSYFDAATPESPNCVEVQFLPRERNIITRDPEHIKAVLTTQFSDFGKGEEFHDLWKPFLGDSIFTTDGQLWQYSRSMIRPMFIKDRISDLATFEKWVSVLLDALPPSGQTVDIMDFFYRMTLDVTTDFLLGASVDSLRNPKSDFVEAFDDVQRIQMMLTTVGPFKSLVPRRAYNEGIKKIEQFIMPYIEQARALPQEELEKLSNSDKHFTFLHSIARYTRDRKVLRDQIIAVLLAGRDTTAATLSWAFYELSHYPEKYSRLRNEILSSVGRTRSPTYEDLKNMSYLRHTINETLRLYPVVPFNIRSALVDTTLPGTPGNPPISVVKGDVVIYSSLSMHRRKDLYPTMSEKFEDPNIFSPERWEDWTPKPWQYLPFNGGPRICVGQNFAITEMAYCMVRILQKYERIEYRGNWYEQQIETEIVGKPHQGVKVGLYEESARPVGHPEPFAA